MNAKELSVKYLDCLYGTGDLKMLRTLLADDLNYKGTYFEYDSADEYVAAFEGESYKEFSYQIMHSFEELNVCCLIFKLIKPSGPLRMSQTITEKDGKISEILLIFDGREFSDDTDDEDEWNL